MSNYKHGMRHTRLYNIWSCMLCRCKDKKNEKYGGRGIFVCKEWLTFEKFKEWAINHGYDDNLSIDRKNNDGNYCPDNCQWSNEIEQANNKRNTRFLTINEEEKSIHDWCRFYNIKYTTVIRRIKIEGLTLKEALTKELHRGRTRLFTINGITKSILQWCKLYNMPYTTIRNRLNRGMSLVEALGVSNV